MRQNLKNENYSNSKLQHFQVPTNYWTAVGSKYDTLGKDSSGSKKQQQVKNAGMDQSNDDEYQKYQNNEEKYKSSVYRPQKYCDVSNDKLSSELLSNHSPLSINSRGYKKQISPPDSKISYHSHYLNNDNSPASLRIPNLAENEKSKNKLSIKLRHDGKANLADSYLDQQPTFSALPLQQQQKKSQSSR